MNSKALFKDLIHQIAFPESKEEIREQVFMLIQHFMGYSKTEILSGKEIPQNPDLLESLKHSIKRLNAGEPVQYITGHQFFYGRAFSVTSDVLIPRPETEGLIDEICSFFHSRLESPTLLDLGTGSGCLSVTLALEIPGAKIKATDISEKALEVARQNALKWNANIDFFLHDMLQQDLPQGTYDGVVSNPPYVSMAEKSSLQKQVIQFEPHQALFVPDDDPLIFYKALVKKVFPSLKDGGILCVEIHENFGKEIAARFQQEGYSSVKILQDTQGKDRIVRGEKSNKG